MTEYQRKFSLKRAEEIYADKRSTGLPKRPTSQNTYWSGGRPNIYTLMSNEKMDLIAEGKVKLRPRSKMKGYAPDLLFDFSKYEKEKKKEYDIALKAFKAAEKALRIKYNNVRDEIMLGDDAEELRKLLEEFAKA